MSFFLYYRLSRSQLKVRLGEHDTKSTNEPWKHIDRDVRTMFCHNKWKTFKSSSRNLVERNLAIGQYDVALISLKQPIEYSMHVVPICLSDDDNTLVGEKAWVKGFGRIGASKYCTRAIITRCLYIFLPHFSHLANSGLLVSRWREVYSFWGICGP
jgi:hypothetical protein